MSRSASRPAARKPRKGNVPSNFLHYTYINGAVSAEEHGRRVKRALHSRGKTPKGNLLSVSWKEEK